MKLLSNVANRWECVWRVQVRELVQTLGAPRSSYLPPFCLPIKLPVSVLFPTNRQHCPLTRLFPRKSPRALHTIRGRDAALSAALRGVNLQGVQGPPPYARRSVASSPTDWLMHSSATGVSISGLTLRSHGRLSMGGGQGIIKMHQT